MSNTQWAEDVALKLRDLTDTAIQEGNDYHAGIHAAHVVTFCNAIARVKKGVSLSLEDDPLFGRFFNINEYFKSPREAAPEDDLGSVHDWSI